MFDFDDDDLDLFDIEPVAQEVTPDELADARAFFMAVLQEVAPESLRRYDAAEAEFNRLLAQIKACSETDTLTPEVVHAGKLAYDAVAEAKLDLHANMARVAYTMSHTAYA